VEQDRNKISENEKVDNDQRREKDRLLALEIIYIPRYYMNRYALKVAFRYHGVYGTILDAAVR
jgi:hypothetical protein